VSERIAVIGGGWAGLACAVELSATGQRVCVFEAARQLGGRARRVEIQGLPLDNGQHILLGAYHETLRLIRLAGADPDTLLERLPLELNHPGGGFRLRLPRLPAPLHLAIGLLGMQGASLREKIAAVRFMRALQRTHYRLREDISVADLLDRHGQTGALRRFMWEPLCLAALNTPAALASAQIFANVLRDSLGGKREDTDLLLPATNLGQLFPEAARRFIEGNGGEVRLSNRIDALQPSLIIGGETFAHVVIATAPQHASTLLRTLPETTETASLLDGYAFEPIGTVYLGYPEALGFPFPMIGLDKREPGRIGQWAFDRSAEKSGQGIAACVLSGEGLWDSLDNETLAATLHRELQDTLGRPLPAPLWHQVIRERRATFSCRPKLARPTPDTPVRNLWLAGDYACADYPATLEGAVRSGVTAARRILAQR
jgi:squalene-associated FAD-dependent desaturase